MLELEFIEHLRSCDRTQRLLPSSLPSQPMCGHGNGKIRVPRTGRSRLRLEEQKGLKAELLRAKLRGEVNQADYAEANGRIRR